MTPIIAVVVSYVSKRFRRISKRIQHSMGDVTHIASEALSGYRVVRTHGAEDYEKQRFEKVSEENRRQSMKEAMTRAVSSPVILMLVAISMALLVWLAMAPSLMASMTPGEFVAFITAAALMIKPVRQLTEINGEIQKGLAAATELFGLLDTTPEQDNGKRIASRLSGEVVIDQVSFRYADEQPNVLHDINLRLAPGSWWR